MKVIYSFNKHGREAEVWEREIAEASFDGCQFIPFNHEPYLDPRRYSRAQLLDNLYFERNAALLRMYDGLDRLVGKTGADVLLVDNYQPYHPEYLRGHAIYKVLRLSDGPVAAYDRDFAYLHAFDHALFHSPAYSADLTMDQKLEYCGCKRRDFWPLALFEAARSPLVTEEDLFRAARHHDLVFVGAMHVGKMPALAKIKKAFGHRCRMHGLVDLKKNVYFNIRHGFPGWISPIRIEDYVPLYRRSKIGFNLHNRGSYTVGSFRLFELPANGVMQISDGGSYLSSFFEPGKEIVGYEDVDGLIELVEYYLTHEAERIDIARAGYRAVLARHTFKGRMLELEKLLGPHVRSR